MYGEHHGQNNQMPPVPPTAQGQAPGNRGDGFGMYNPTDYVPFGGPIAPGQAPGNRGDGFGMYNPTDYVPFGGPIAPGQAPGNRGDGFGMYNPTDYVPFGGPIAPGQAPGNRGDKKWRCLLAPCLISFEYAGQLRFHMRDRHGIDYFDGKKQIATWYSN